MFTSADLTSLRQRRRDLAGLGANIKLLRSQWTPKSGFDPNQPRVPAGHPDGGQWTDSGGDLVRVAQLGPRGSGQSRYQWPGATFGQQLRLIEATVRANIAVGRVRERERHWQPQASAHTARSHSDIDAAIRAQEALVVEANGRHFEHMLFGIGPGPYAGRSIPARGPGRNFTEAERLEINQIGLETGCHGCGTRVPGTIRNNFIKDHQTPNAFRLTREDQRLFPHCVSCSVRQGYWLSENMPPPP